MMSSDKPLAKNGLIFDIKCNDNNNRFSMFANNCITNETMDSMKGLIHNHSNCRQIYVKDFNELISCHLCRGYLIDATTVIECLHSFCKTCLVNYFDSNTPKSRFCPKCDNQIHKTKPKLNIRSDPTLQDIVYKLVPGLYKNEMNRRKDFYSREPKSVTGLSNEERGEISGERLIFTPEDSIFLSIEYFPQYVSHSLIPFSKNLSNGALNCEPEPNGSKTRAKNDSQRRYLKCEGGMRVIHLKKWLKLKYDVKDFNDIEILYKHYPLLDDYTMIDLAYIYSYRLNVPLCLYYKILDQKSIEDYRLFRPPFSVPKRRNKSKLKKKILNKKRKLINESNLITTNPVNEPLIPIPHSMDSSLINKVVFCANLDLMTTAVNLSSKMIQSSSKYVRSSDRSRGLAQRVD